MHPDGVRKQKAGGSDALFWVQEYHVAEAKRSDKYEPPGIITPGGIIKYRKHEVGVISMHACMHAFLQEGDART